MICMLILYVNNIYIEYVAMHWTSLNCSELLCIGGRLKVLSLWHVSSWKHESSIIYLSQQSGDAQTGYKHRQARKKSLPWKKDIKQRFKICSQSLPVTFGLKTSAFTWMGAHLNSISNPSYQARPCKSLVWRRRSSGLNQLRSTERKKAGSGGKVATLQQLQFTDMMKFYVNNMTKS